MTATVAERRGGVHPERAERMAKMDLRFSDQQPRDFRQVIGEALARAISLVGWTLKEAGAALDKDPRQVARWLNGQERAQFDAIFAVEELRQPMLIALSEIAGAGVERETVIRIQHRRSA